MPSLVKRRSGRYPADSKVTGERIGGSDRSTSALSKSSEGSDHASPGLGTSRVVQTGGKEMAVVPPTAGRFADDTAYERLVLSQLSDVVKIALGQGSATLDIRGPNNLVAIGVHEVVGAGAVQDALRPMQPLAFGAAYKILDLLVELVMDLNGPVTGRRTMKDKQAFARSPIRGPLPSPLGTARPSIPLV